jgi:hypothetical protein
MVRRCDNGDFRTNRGRCVGPNPWVQWIVRQGGLGHAWPPSASYRDLDGAARQGLRDAGVAMHDHTRDVRGMDDVCGFFAQPGVASPAYERRDRRLVDDRPQRTLSTYPQQKHERAKEMALHMLGWPGPDPDGVAPNTGNSFSAATVRTILRALDRVYFRGTLLQELDRRAGRALTVRSNLRLTLPVNAYAYYVPQEHTIEVHRELLFACPLPVHYEGVEHPSYLEWLMGILKHELTHVVCFAACRADTPCRRESDFHGAQFGRLLRTMWARGPVSAGRQPVPADAVVIAALPLAYVCRHVGRPQKGGGDSGDSFRGGGDSFQGGGSIFTVAWNGSHCILAHAPSPTSPRRTSPRRTSPRRTSPRRKRKSPSARRLKF